jgi:Rrf2 family nitric oxide-sensitive transcriptional repressor
MEVSLHSDYSFRVLIYLALQPESEGLSQIKTIAETFAISEHHLIKVVQNLVKFGYVDSYRGRGGGIKLAMDPAKINLGQVFRRTEPNLKLLSCFDPTNQECRIAGFCDLQGVFGAALQAFLRELDAVTLDDVIGNKRPLRKALALPGEG